MNYQFKEKSTYLSEPTYVDPISRSTHHLTVFVHDIACDRSCAFVGSKDKKHLKVFIRRDEKHGEYFYIPDELCGGPGTGVYVFAMHLDPGSDTRTDVPNIAQNINVHPWEELPDWEKRKGEKAAHFMKLQQEIAKIALIDLDDVEKRLSSLNPYQRYLMEYGPMSGRTQAEAQKSWDSAQALNELSR